MYRLERKGWLSKRTQHLTAAARLSSADFESIARELGRTFHQAVKVGFVAAHKAEMRQIIETHYEGHETTNTANVGDWIVTNMTPAGKPLRDMRGRLNTYVIPAEAFERLYDAADRQSDFGPLYSPRGKVSALELPASFDIMAPWQQRQRGKSGYLVRSGDEIYCVEKSAFHRTYDVRGPAASRLSKPGRKRLLALDGGGVRGILTLAFLERLEAELRQQHGKPDLVLSDYFDMIGGTSVGSILATLLALGEPVERIKSLFWEACPNIFSRPSIWRYPHRVIPGLIPRFDARYLERWLNQKLGDLRMGSPELKCGLCIVTKRVDTGSPWVLTNNPRSKYWLETDERVVANKEYRLADVVRASTAAPYFFRAQRMQIALGEGEKPGLFVDGGVSPFNNPALQMLMVAGIAGYGLDWKFGEDNLFIVSIGTGSYRFRSDGRGIPAQQAVAALQGIISDGEALTLTILQWMSASTNRWQINSEIGDFSNDYLGREVGLTKPLLRFSRYDAPLEAEWLKEKLGVDLSARELESLRDFTNPKNMSRLEEVGRAAANKQINAEHLPDGFIVDTSGS